MNKRENSGLVLDRSKGTENYGNINIRREANQIANTVKANNCEIVRISKGKTPIVKHKIVENQMEIVVPVQLPIDRLAFYIESFFRGRKKVKIEIVGNETPERKESVHVCKRSKNTHSKLKSKKGDDDGTGTGPRHGKIRRKRKYY